MGTTAATGKAELIRLLADLQDRADEIQREIADTEKLLLVALGGVPKQVAASTLNPSLAAFLGRPGTRVRDVGAAVIFAMGPMSPKEIIGAAHRHGFPGLKTDNAVEVMRNAMGANVESEAIRKRKDGAYEFASDTLGEAWAEAVAFPVTKEDPNA